LLEDNAPNTDQVKDVVTQPIPIGADLHGLMRYKERIVLDYNVLNPLDHAGYFQVFCIGRADRRREREFYRITDHAASTRKTGESENRKTGKRKGKGKGKGDRHGGKGDQRTHPPGPASLPGPFPGDDEEDKAGAAKKKRQTNRAERRKKKRVSARTEGPKAAAKPKPEGENYQDQETALPQRIPLPEGGGDPARERGREQATTERPAALVPTRRAAAWGDVQHCQIPHAP